MEQTYEEWEAVNEVIGRWAFHPREAEEMAKRIVDLEAYIDKREEYVEFLVKELGDAQAEVELLKIECTIAHMGY